MDIQWHDPSAGLALLPKITGLDFMKKVAAGELPGTPMLSHSATRMRNVGFG